MTLTEFHEKLPGAPAQFVLDAYESGETAESASKRWMQTLLAERDELKQQVIDLGAVRYAMPGVEPLVGGVPRVWC